MYTQGRTVSCLVLCFLFATAYAGCGRKTDPLTPDSPRPEVVRDLAATVRDTTAYLTWTLPAKNIEGKPLAAGDLKAFRIYRAEAENSNRRLRYHQTAEILMESPAPADIRGATITWSDKDLHYARVYAYRVRSYSARGGASDYSNEVRAVPLPSLTAPCGVTAVGGDGTVTLSWEAVTTRTNGAAIHGYTGYNIYRGAEAGKIDQAPLNRAPVTENGYQDAGVENGKTYYYRVRAVDSPVTPWRESQDSEEIVASPRDLTPPEPPQGLAVVSGIGRVFLTWNENRERDLAGYHVYRTDKSSGGEAERLTDVLIKRTTFSDETVKPGAVYIYWVTAVDRSGNESVRSREFKATLETIR